MKRFSPFLLLLAGVVSCLQSKAFTPDTTLLRQMRDSAMSSNTTMAILTPLTDLYATRLNGTEGYAEAARFLEDTLKAMGFSNVHTETYAPLCKNWRLTSFSAQVASPHCYPLDAFPKAYTKGTNGSVRGEVIALRIRKMEDLENYRGKLKGKIVLIAGIRPVPLITDPMVTRMHDTTLQRLATQPMADSFARAEAEAQKEQYNQRLKRYLDFMTTLISFCAEEEALLLLDQGSQQYGSVRAWNAGTAKAANDYFEFNSWSSYPENEVPIPQIALSLEQYNSIARLVRSGQKVELEFNIGVEVGSPAEGFNLLAEIPGSDLKSEVVLLGAHLDDYPVGKGATDNGAGIVTCIEALKLIKEAGIQPRRTIRIGFFGGEEQNLLGSRAYVKEHCGENSDERLQVYFNMDNGAGRFRGIYAQENEKAKEIFESWIPQVNEPDYRTVTIQETENTDHISFDEAGLPGFQFIQDPLDYYSVFHTNMDVLERIPPDDLKQASYVMAAMAYLAATMEGEFPQPSTAGH